MSAMDDKRRAMIAKAVRQARLRAGLTQGELAERVGASKGAISNLERRLSATKPETLRRLEQVLDLDLSGETLIAHELVEPIVAKVEERVAALDTAQRIVFLGQLLTYVAGWDDDASDTASAPRGAVPTAELNGHARRRPEYVAN